MYSCIINSLKLSLKFDKMLDTPGILLLFPNSFDKLIMREFLNKKISEYLSILFISLWPVIETILLISHDLGH